MDPAEQAHGRGRGTDSREEALTYIRRLTLGNEPDPALVEIYVDTAAEMLDYLESKTPLRMGASRLRRLLRRPARRQARRPVDRAGAVRRRGRSSASGRSGCAPGRTCRG